MIQNNICYSSSSILETLGILNKTGKGYLIVLNEKNKKYLGTITDGDIRKYLAKHKNLNSDINKIYNKKSTFIKKNDLSKINIINFIKKKKIKFLPIVDSSKKIYYVYEQGNSIFNNNENRVKENTAVVLMAGGMGTRLRPFTDILPKPLISINGISLISNIMNYFTLNGYNNFFPIINKNDKIFPSYMDKQKFNVNINYIFEEKRLGTAGGLQFLKSYEFENFIVVNADIALVTNFDQIAKFHFKSNNDVTVMVSDYSHKIPFGHYKSNKNGNISSIVEKEIINRKVGVGCYFLKKNVLKFIKKNEKIDMNIFLTRLIKKKFKVKSFEIKKNHWHEFGDINQINKFI